VTEPTQEIRLDLIEHLREENALKLKNIAQTLAGCTRCPLSCGRTNIVMGQGDPCAKIVFVGEAPGAEEDKTGLAFVGRSGQLLTKMIEAMGLTRNQTFIANVAKCRPPNNRPPTQEEMATCSPFLLEQLKIINPKIIVALGKTATVGLGLLKHSDSLGPMRGKIHKWNEISVIVTYHPAYLLRDPASKAKAWADLQLALPFLTE
jgi:uracil-DNA glycosylase family 4